MSGECGYNVSKFLGGSSLEKSASLTLERLNLMMKQTSDWREERLLLESNIHRLKSTIQKLGKSPEEALRPDPMVVHQRSEINRLELTKSKLEDEIRCLRETLRESDQAITCSGAKRLKEKMRKMRAESAEERRKLNDEIGHLKLRVKEAEDDSSCSSLCRLRIKLREILNGDKKIDRLIADVASTSCGTVIDLSNEITRMKELLDELRLQNIGLNRQSERLKADLESAPNTRMVSAAVPPEHLETIERLAAGFHVDELEPKIEEVRDDLGLVKRIEELENVLNENRKKIEDNETVVTSLRNELLGAKTAYNIKSQELKGIQNCKNDFENLKNTLEERDEFVTELERELKTSVCTVQGIEKLRNELDKVKTEILNVEIERDGLSDEVQKMANIVSDRNEQIVKILEENESREEAGRSEIEGMKTELRVTLAENENLKVRCVDLEEEVSKLNETSEASGDRNAPFLKKIKQLEEELTELRRLSSVHTEKDLVGLNSELRIMAFQVQKESEELVVAKLTKGLNESETENEILRNEIQQLEERNFELVDDLQRIIMSSGEEEKLADKMGEVKNQETQIKDDLEDKFTNLELNYTALRTELMKIISERDKLKHEFKKLISENQKLKTETEECERKIDELKSRNEEIINEKVRRYEILIEKLETVKEELRGALEEVNSLKKMKSSIDEVRVENEELKTVLKKESKEKEELVKSMERLRMEFEERSKKMLNDKNNECKKLTSSSETKTETKSKTKTKTEMETLVMNSGDYIRADRELKYYIHLQSLAIKRVVDFISYVEGTTSLKPAMATFLEPATKTNFMVLNFDENLTATFRMSQKLSEKIFTAEMNVQKLESLKYERNNLIVERDCLNKGMQKISTMLSKFGQEISIPRDEGLTFENETAVSWQETKIDQESADSASGIMERILKNSQIQEDEDNLFRMNHRISSLQNQIKFKKKDAAKRLIEMRETMRQERIRLMEIADVENVPFTHTGMV